MTHNGNRIAGEPQRRGIESLREEAASLHKQEIPGGDVTDREPSVDEQPARGIVELADIGAPGAVGESAIEKVFAIRQDSGSPVSPARSTRVTGVTGPPVADTRRIGRPGTGPKRITPSLFHVPPRP